MLSINNDFLGYHPQEHAVLFSGSDTSEIFADNIKTQPDDWYYRTNAVSYKRNTYGHRCKNIDEIDLDNYILFAGCSHTEGIGLKIEDTYPYLLSKKMNCDYYNLGIAATGVDVLNYNLVTWFAKIKKPPKVLVLQWPHNTRITLQNYPESPNIKPEPFYQYGVWRAKSNKKLGIFLTFGEQLNFFNTASTLTKKLIHTVATCPIIEINTPIDVSADVDTKLIQVDYARDTQKHNGLYEYGHMGVESQIINTELIYQKIKNVIS
jgi:hypothetical protein